MSISTRCGPGAVPTLLRDDHPQSRELRLGLTEKEDEFKFSDDVAPEARRRKTSPRVTVRLHWRWLR
jgi:hypothetical protein